MLYSHMGLTLLIIPHGQMAGGLDWQVQAFFLVPINLRGGEGGGAGSPRSRGEGMKAEPPFLPAIDTSSLAFYYN